MSILLVDDEPRNVLALEAVLGSVDCSLVKAHSGRSALKFVLAQDFAVIILDVRMAGLDGFETASLIRARERSHSTPIIFMTAFDPLGAQMREGYRLGGIDYIRKPFDPHILRSKVTFFVELFRKSVALAQATADLVLREQQVVALNAELEDRVIRRTAALVVARAEAEKAAGRASVLSEISRVLVENFLDLRPMLSRVAHIASVATDTACVIQLLAEDADPSSLPAVMVEHADAEVRAELNRAFSAAPTLSRSAWYDLDRAFLDRHPLSDSLSVPMLARASNIGVLSLGRFGADAPHLSYSDRIFSADLTARVAIALENARLYEKARMAIESRDNFLTVAAHELKTPLTVIQGYSQLLSYQAKTDPKEQDDLIRRSASMIEERTRHLARLVEQILDVSRLVTSRMRLTRVDADLVGMMKELVAGFASRDAAPRIRLHVRQEHVAATVDLVRLRQVMANLIDNAVRYSPAREAIDVTVDDDADDSIVLSVRDRGLGVPQEHRAHIFDRFHRAHVVEYRSGMGLGLHISREIVLLHGGTITAAFPADGGSQFTVQLPRALVTPAA